MALQHVAHVHRVSRRLVRALPCRGAKGGERVPDQQDGAVEKRGAGRYHVRERLDERPLRLADQLSVVRVEDLLCQLLLLRPELFLDFANGDSDAVMDAIFVGEGFDVFGGSLGVHLIPHPIPHPFLRLHFSFLAGDRISGVLIISMASLLSEQSPETNPFGHKGDH